MPPVQAHFCGFKWCSMMCFITEQNVEKFKLLKVHTAKEEPCATAEKLLTCLSRNGKYSTCTL